LTQSVSSNAPPIPRLILLGESVLLEGGDEEREELAALARLEFSYSPHQTFVAHHSGPEAHPHRDAEREAEAARLLESLGAVELERVDGVLADFDTRANYYLCLKEDTHTGCSFASLGVARLRAAGFVVEEEPSFPFPTLPADAPWYGNLEPDEKLDWFHIEIGIEIEGRPYNLVPALVELLERLGSGTALSELANLRARVRAVPLGDGRFVVVPWERLERIFKVIADLYPEDGRGPREALRLPIARMNELPHLTNAFSETGPALSWLSGKDWISRAKKLAAPPVWTPAPASLRARLRPYQHEGLMWLEHKRDAGVGAILADDMGLGKTLQTIALLAREKEARRMDIPSLILTPTSLVDNWEREIEKFAPHLRVVTYSGPGRHAKITHFNRAEIIITSYPILIRDLTPLTDREFHYVILDEAQAIKNERSQASTSVRTLSARHRVALSGTPVENNLRELWALVEFTHPGLLGRSSEFKKHFRDPIEKFGDEERLLVLRTRVAPFILRRLKESVAPELPAKTEMVRAVELCGQQRDLYESIRLSSDADVRQAISKNGVGGSTVAILDALMKLRQVCCDPRLVRLESASEVKNSAKYTYFFELLEGQLKAGRRILVFSQFARMLGLLEAGLKKRGIKSLCLTGSSRNRQELVDAFEAKKADVFLISLKAGGTGLNLVSADTVIHYDPWWNAAAQMQATDRAYRIGQKKPVFVYNLIVSSSVEERMLTLQRRKRNLADNLLQSGAMIAQLDENEIADLFSPLGSHSKYADSDAEGSDASSPSFEHDDEDDNALAR
jgi:superfamily II DNA or RNA helicase